MAETIPLRSLLASTFGGGTPPRDMLAYWGGDVPWASVKDLTDKTTDLYRTQESLTPAGVTSSATTVVSPGAILIATRMAVGRCAIAGVTTAINQDLKALIVDETRAVPRFVLHTLKYLRPRLEAVAVGSTVAGIRLEQLHSIQVLAASLEEQRRIADVLDTIDDVIHKTEQLIAKLKQMKQGLLHDLLTRGVDDNGELRDPERHPEQFKESSLGRIPKAWDVLELRNVYSEPSRNGLYKAPRFHGRGQPMIQMGNIFSSFDVQFEGAGRVDVSSAELRTFGLKVGDVLFARRSLVFEGAGKCALVREVAEPSTFESSIVRVRVNEAKVQPLFAAQYLSCDASYRDRRRFIRQVAVSGVSSTDIAQFLMAVPSIDEQRQICACMTALENHVLKEEALWRKLKSEKRGLMEDLLTGRVRTTALEAAA